MKSRMNARAAWAVISVNLALVAGSIAVALQHDARSNEAPLPRQTIRAAAESECPGCATFGFAVPMPRDMLMAEPIATF